MNIADSFEWTLQVGAGKIESDRKPLSALPQMLTTVSAVVSVMKGMDSFRFCPGNEDERYFPIQAARKGVFKDSTGIQSWSF